MSKHIYVSVDVETSGDVPGLYSMISLGAVAIEKGNGPGDWLMTSEFYTEMSPLPGAEWKKETERAHGITEQEARAFNCPEAEMARFVHWLDNLSNHGEHKLIFLSDNPIFDGGFVFYYLHRFCKRCPFGWSGLSLTSLFKGLKADLRANMRDLRKVAHNHNALQDAKGNATAWIQIRRQLKPT